MSVNAITRLSANPAGFGDRADELSQNMFASAVPTQHSHEYFDNEEIGLYVGVWDTDDMTEKAGPYDSDEFMWLLEGEAEIKNIQTGAVEKVRAGEAFIIPRGYDCQWCQTGYLRKFYVISENPGEPVPEKPAHEGIIILRADATAGVVTTGTPFATATGAAGWGNICYTDTTGKFIAGNWAADAFAADAAPCPRNEFVYVHAGAISLQDARGNEQHYTAGEAFFIPEGTVCSAKVNESVGAFFAGIRSA